MHITWHGLGCVKLQTSTGTVLLNPFQDNASFKMSSLKVDIAATANENDEHANNLERLQGEPFLIEHPGEYEIKDVFIYGIRLGSDTGFVISAEGMTIGHPGMQVEDYTEKQLDRFESVDILLLPLTGSTVKQQSALISQIEPRIVIPIHFKTAKTKKAPDDWATLDGFAKEMGKKDLTPESKVIVKANKLPQDEQQVIVLDVT
jgi:L-ascorbate metabolism protein UlaG (beta-lactamase superfamily)